LCLVFRDGGSIIIIYQQLALTQTMPSHYASFCSARDYFE
jgi:hypothetical protein